MMDWTDRHCRWFHRQLSHRLELYTEMVVADAVIHGPRERLLGFDDIEHPVVLQIGGSDPNKLAEASKVGESYGYDAININIGCPSDRVQSGRFGACLMAEPDLVAQCFSKMKSSVSVPVTVKCRLGIDEQDLQKTLPEFISKVSAAGCETFIIHARESEGLDGFMIGRAAYHTPWILTDIDSVVYGDVPFELTRDDIVMRLIKYLKGVESEDRSAKALLRHIMGLYSGEAGARTWRRSLSEGASSGENPSAVLEKAYDAYRITANELAA